MVLPYLKGLISIKRSISIYSNLVISWVYLQFLIFSYQIYKKWYQSTFLGKSGDFFLIFCRNFLGRRVCRSDLYVLRQNLQNLIADLDSL